MYPTLIDQKLFDNVHLEDKLYYCSNRANLINAIELKKKNKGCDASNAFDEEVSEGEKDYSDDEEEVCAKIKRKNKRKNKKIKIQEDNTMNNNTNMNDSNNQNNQVNVNDNNTKIIF